MELIWNKAADDSEVLLLAHGAGSGMDSYFMERMAQLICESGVTVVRFEFDYMQQRRATGSRRPPDRQPKLLSCWAEVLKVVFEEVKKPVFIGGKSMGGRMATLLVDQYESEENNSPISVQGVVCLGYPFYAAGKQDKPRTEHLMKLETSVLILQGERDAMGDFTAVSDYSLSPDISIHWLPDGNHDLKPRKVSGYSHENHLQTSASMIHEFCTDL
ncbi:MAG: alpha/beta family hydrolase [Endozoicomonas sp.]